jgi:hypothetical protein
MVNKEFGVEGSFIRDRAEPDEFIDSYKESTGAKEITGRRTRVGS